MAALTNSKQHILCVHLGASLGGASLCMLEVLKKLRAAGTAVTVALPEEGPFSDRLKAEGIPCRFLPLFIFYYCTQAKTRISLKNFFLVLKALLGNVIFFSILLSHIKPTLVVINTSTPLLCGLIAKSMGYRVIWHVREVFLIEKTGIFQKMISAIIRFSSQRVFVQSRFSQSDLANFGVPGATVLYDGSVDLGQFQVRTASAQERESVGLRPSDPVVGFVGMLYREKGWHVLVQAAFLVLKEIPNAQFLIVGSADMMKREVLGGAPQAPLHAEDVRFHQMVSEMKMDHAFRFMGQRSNVENLLPLMDCLAFTTITSEAFGRVMVEAMACGLPVVASNNGASSEIVETDVTGLLIPPDNPVALAEALVLILTDREKALKMGRLGRERAERLFDVKKNLEGLDRLYSLNS